MLTQKEFDLLTLLADGSSVPSQRQLAQLLSCSVGSVNKLVRDLQARGLLDENRITQAGLHALEPYRVKRAIFIAAGFSSRLVPITLNTPKPLVRVQGKRIIDTMLDAVVKAGIPEILIVRGYLGEQFDQLLHLYPNIRFAENPVFNECNNIASAMCVRDLFQNAYVLDADLILKNPGLIRTYEYQSNLLAVPVERTDDWCVQADKAGFVSSLSLGGTHGYREVGISYWDREDGARLSEDLETVFQSPGGRERYWEQVPLLYCKDRYRIAIRKCQEADVTEVDTFSELKALDRAYAV